MRMPTIVSQHPTPDMDMDMGARARAQAGSRLHIDACCSWTDACNMYIPCPNHSTRVLLALGVCRIASRVDFHTDTPPGSPSWGPSTAHSRSR